MSPQRELLSLQDELELAQEVPEQEQEVPELAQGEPAEGWRMTLLLKPRELEVWVRPQALVRRCWERSWQTMPPSASGPSLTESGSLADDATFSLSQVALELELAVEAA